MSAISQKQMDDPRTVLHWYDFLCPFCYVAQNRNAILVRRGLNVIELPFQAHPDIPNGGISAGQRKGPMYTVLESEAKEVGLPLHWPGHLPNTRLGLAAAEWVRRNQPRESPEFHKQLFEAHFALGQDLEDPAVLNEHAVASGVDIAALRTALSDGTATELVAEAEKLGRQNGVHGTPAWLLNEQLITGLRSAAEFEWLPENALRTP
jgi:predicted DsbA family dithiol-disulfide isomerase